MSAVLETSRPRSALAPKFCREPRFMEFLRVQGHDVLCPASAQETVRAVVEVGSLAEIIYTDEALERFEQRILRPYMAFLNGGMAS